MTDSLSKRVIHTVFDKNHMHRTTATTARGCHPPSTVLERANNNNVVRTKGSPTHPARHGPAPVWHRRHRTHSARGRGHIVTDTNTQKWEENSVQQWPHARTTNHTHRNSDASR
ncbi:hypothetical protein TcCL_Unassigned01694 [Trypanosoma cruzi]|nr:hypothetical protein TcCL_Unassigned01694 [Trypanosoma cruzi]